MVTKKINRLTIVSTCVSLIAIGAFFYRRHQSAQAISDTFPVRATLQLCGDYPYGGITVELQYRLTTETTYHPVTITSQSIDSSTNTGTFDFSLPSTFQSVPIAVAAFCRSGLGLGGASAEVTITNCDALAIHDTDFDGIPDNQEDLNCDNFFSPGDSSNLNNLDTDGDGVRDLVERVSGTDATNPGSSPRPYIFSSAPFDPNGDGESNAVVFRPANGTWYVKDFYAANQPLVFGFGANGDIPFAYQPKGAPVATTDVGVIRRSGLDYQWFFHGQGFTRSNGTRLTTLTFGIFGDNIVLGPWEEPGVTSPAVARLFNNIWFFDIYLKDGTIRHVAWGGNGDVPKVQDYDGDGLFDIAVFRPSEQKTYIIRSKDNVIAVYNFGSGTADFTPRGDYTGDGVDDITFWEPITGLFTSMTSNNGFNDTLAQAKNPSYYKESQLGLYFVHLPLNWNRRGGRIVYTVVDHATGNRFYRTDNVESNPIIMESWGLAGDAFG